jgi:hypothetical protein
VPSHPEALAEGLLHIQIEIAREERLVQRESVSTVM